MENDDVNTQIKTPFKHFKSQKDLSSHGFISVWIAYQFRTDLIGIYD